MGQEHTLPLIRTKAEGESVLNIVIKVLRPFSSSCLAISDPNLGEITRSRGKRLSSPSIQEPHSIPEESLPGNLQRFRLKATEFFLRWDAPMPGAHFPRKCFHLGVDVSRIWVSEHVWPWPYRLYHPLYSFTNFTENTKILMENLEPRAFYFVEVRYCLTRHMDTCGEPVYTTFDTLRGESSGMRLIFIAHEFSI